ncbi:MAG: alpha-L-fucosidase, partial [bacterium]|nr:alpha-L-fucosidase [bacterium]
MNNNILQWWEEARFGMFIHWGLYAVPAGTWKGEQIPGIGEWIMFRTQIPVKEYEELAKEFNPVKFNAEAWVQLAKEAGMKYLVITSKHHDGFAMYDSQASDYNIVAATPFKRDPMKELAEACREAGLKFCFYYSQDQDWHEPGGRGNSWDFPTLTPEAFAGYLEQKVKPQVKEILTQYGPIGLIWFDTPGIITKEQSLELKRFVHELQPDCLVSGRVGHGVGDYQSMGDNQIPSGPVQGAWETPATLNDTWGFKSYDRNWKSTKELLCLLVDLAGKGVNYLLNVGPTAEGVIPEPSVQRLKEIGAWMQVNGEAVYGTQPNPYPYELPWGRITCKSGKLYLHFFEWPKEHFLLKGLKNTVIKASLLADPSQALNVTQTRDDSLNEHRLELELPATPPDRYISVVVLEIEGSPDVEEGISQQADGNIALPAHLAEITASTKDIDLKLDRSSLVINWKDTDSSLAWDFAVSHPGQFAVSVSTAAFARPHIRQGGHTVEITVGNQVISSVMKKELELDSPRTRHFPEAESTIGT